MAWSKYSIFEVSGSENHALNGIWDQRLATLDMEVEQEKSPEGFKYLVIKELSSMSKSSSKNRSQAHRRPVI